MPAATKYYGKYQGSVVGVDDPEGLGRIQVSVPSIRQGTLGWEIPCVSATEYRSGVLVLPPIDTAIWVEFAAGDLRQPIWSGCFWTGKDQPPATVKTHAAGS